MGVVGYGFIFEKQGHKFLGTGDHQEMGIVGSKYYRCLVCGKRVYNKQWKNDRKALSALRERKGI